MKKFISAAFSLLFVFITAQCFADGDSKVNSYQYMKKLNSVFEFVQQNYVDEVDAKILYEGALKGMMEALGDPYSVYLDSNSMRDLTDTTAGSFGGVGLYISKAKESSPEKPSYVEVSSAIEDTPGAKAGIQSGDMITAIDGKPTPEMTIDEVLSHLRGEIGTPVTVTILRGTNMKFDVRLIRDRIEVQTVKYTMLENSKIGYMRLIQFTPETTNRVQDALDDFEKKGYTSLIIDLRDNPGGVITGAIDVADKFIDDGVIVSTKSRLLFENQQFTASKGKTKVSKKIPIVVLINRGSASASEILSGALKDYHLAYLIGEKSYGKGSVQQVRLLSKEDGFKLTMARYYTPSDVNIDKIGIPPDLEVKNLEKFTPEEEELYVKLLNSNVINDYVEKHPNMSEKEISAKANEIRKTYALDARLLRRLIRVQVLKNRTDVYYDLDFDLQLNEAIKLINNTKDFEKLLKGTKTLKQLQDEAKLTETETK